MPPPPRPSGPWWRRAAAVALVAMTIGAVAVYVVHERRPGDISNPDVEFVPEPPPEPPRPQSVSSSNPKSFWWPVYGYDKARTRYLPASPRLRPPLTRRWSQTGRILLEFPPVIGGRSLYMLKNNGALYALSKRTGEVRWKRKLGYLAAASPAYAWGTVYVVMLARRRGVQAGRVVALDARTGRTRWSRKLPSRSESSPLIHRGRLYLGSEDGTVYALRAKTGSIVWRYKADGAVKGGLALGRGRLFFGDYGGKVHAIRLGTGRRVWRSGTSGGAFGLSAGNFYSTPAVAFGRVYLGNTDGRVYSLAASDGELAWAKKTGGYVYSSPAVADLSGLGPTVWIGSYDGRLYALNARSGEVRWSHDAGGRISGAPTVVGDIVYFSNLADRSTIALGARTGKQVWRFGRGAFNPVVSDGRRIFLTGYSSVYAFAPKGCRCP